jgi:hypothetical protein
MSEEEKHFERSQTGHDANDLHKHGGLDKEAHEDKTERENLEEAIEALDDSYDIEEVEKIDDSDKEEKAEEPEKADEPEEVDEPMEFKEEPIEEAEPPLTDWKAKPDNQPYMTVDEVIEPKEKKKGGLGWKIATFLFLLIAIAGCGAAAFLFFSNGKINFLGRTVESYPEGKRPGQTQQQATKPEFQFDEAKIDYASLRTLMPEGAVVSPIKVEYSKDGKYVFVIADVYTAETGYAGTWYRAVEKDSEWVELQAGQGLPLCSELDEAKLKMIEDYGYIDDDLESQYVGCNEEVVIEDDAEAPVEEAPAE